MKLFRSLQEGVMAPWTRWVAKRYLRSKEQSRFLNFITVFSIAGLTLGVSALIVVLSVMEGFEVQLRKRLLATERHLLVTPEVENEKRLGAFESSPAFAWLKEKEPKLRASPFVQLELVLKGPRRLAGVTVKGADAEFLNGLREKLVEERTTGLAGSTVDREENAGLSPIYLGQELAYDLGVLPGDVLTVVSPVERDGPFSAIPRMRRFRLEGIYRVGMPEVELHQVFVPIESLWSFLRKAEYVTQWEIRLDSQDRAESYRQAIEKKLQAQGFRVQDWIQLNGHLFFSLKLERFGMFLGLLFIVIVASFNIVTSLTLMVQEKRKDIGIFRAMGARGSEVGAIFFSKGIFIGVMGVIFGNALGISLCLFLKNTALIQLPSVYYDRTLPVAFLPHYYIGISVATLAIVLIASIYPARKASELDLITSIKKS